jgi:hypothetical protein
MSKVKRKIFETDRRMELRLRLAAKQIGIERSQGSLSEILMRPPEPEVLDRLIQRVRSL